MPNSPCKIIYPRPSQTDRPEGAVAGLLSLDPPLLKSSLLRLERGSSKEVLSSLFLELPWAVVLE